MKHMGGSGPLDGVVVVEMATVLAGPYAGHLLRLLGAEVIKVEDPRGDPFRQWGADSPDVTGHMFEWVNAGKRSLVVDFRSDPEADERMLELLRDADVLLVSGRPGSLERRRLAPARCHEVNPDLVIASLTGYGADGPLSDLPAYDSVVQAVTGLLSAYGVRAELISTSLPPVADMVGGLVLTQAVLAGLVSAARGRGGRVVETSLYEAMRSLMAPTYLRSRMAGDRLQQSLIFQLPCADGEEIVVHLSSNDTFWRKLVATVDESLALDPRFTTYAGQVSNYEALRDRLAVAFAARSAREWERVLAERDVPARRVLTSDEALDHPHAAAIGMVSRRPDGSTRVGGPWRVDGVRPSIDDAAPKLGEFTPNREQS